MARPLSEEKRQALLDAAADFVATLGTGASMAKVDGGAESRGAFAKVGKGSPTKF
ncbi:hypothetical protein AB2M95_04795 [Pseudomonas chlororaphis]|uniref:hypothetical protein n=1 Tax=Pseudomonas chlororaphis TaxID=587753 RepID=UPI001C83BCCC|nr:hypothetical protein [Pseudomonas chlororaphis]